MKLLPVIFHLTLSGTINPSTDVKRVISGSFFDTIQKWGELYPMTIADGELPLRRKEAPIRFKSFDSLLAMIVFSKDVNGFDHEGESLSDKQKFKSFKNEMKRLEDQYTNYGCYCYISGPESGVHGGGKPRDQVDQHCKDLYQCYKCLGMDFNATHTDMAEMEYQVTLDQHADGTKDITCQDSFDMTEGCPRNLCECDRRFAEAIALLDDQCQTSESSDDPFDPKTSCQAEQWYTTTATQSPFDPDTNPGPFDPIDIANCDADTSGHDDHHEKSYCCGVYPDRYPYNPNNRDCCELTNIDTFLDIVNIKEMLVPGGTCQARGGLFIAPEHMIHNHAHDTVMGADSMVLGRSFNTIYQKRMSRTRRRSRK